MSGSDEDWVVDINGWDLKVSLAEELERSMADLTEHLYHYLYEVEETEEGPEWLPPSGYPYCGCTTCDVREALVVLVPLIAQAVTENRIRRTVEPPLGDVVPLLPHRDRRTS